MNHILFLDIETVSQEANYELLSPEWKELWKRKAEALLKSREDETVDSIYNRAGIYAEFGKIICISCGVIQGYGEEKKIAVKSYFGHDEALLLHQFSDMLRKWSADGNKYVCAHNGKEFDFPYLCRRMIINNVPIPTTLNTAGKKPWEVSHLDTMELWKFGDFKSYTSLNLLAHTLGIPTPKDDIDGSMVGDVYWNEKNLERIAVYCQKDVVTAAQIYLRIQGESIIKPENIEYK